MWGIRGAQRLLVRCLKRDTALLLVSRFGKSISELFCWLGNNPAIGSVIITSVSIAIRQVHEANDLWIVAANNTLVGRENKCPRPFVRSIAVNLPGTHRLQDTDTGVVRPIPSIRGSSLQSTFPLCSIRNDPIEFPCGRRHSDCNWQVLL